MAWRNFPYPAGSCAETVLEPVHRQDDTLADASGRRRDILPRLSALTSLQHAWRNATRTSGDLPCRASSVEMPTAVIRHGARSVTLEGFGVVGLVLQLCWPASLFTMTCVTPPDAPAAASSTALLDCTLHAALPFGSARARYRVCAPRSCCSRRRSTASSRTYRVPRRLSDLRAWPWLARLKSETWHRSLLKTPRDPLHGIARETVAPYTAASRRRRLLCALRGIAATTPVLPAFAPIRTPRA